MTNLRVVRAIGSGCCHVAQVHEDDVVDTMFLGASCRIVKLDPVVAVCGVQLREARGSVVLMRKAKVGCRPCARLSGVRHASL